MGASASKALKNATGKSTGISNRTSGQPAAREHELESFLGGWASGSARNCADLPEERYLSDADPRLGSLISRVIEVEGPRRYQPSNASSHFDAIARSIVYQQLSKKAAATIYGRYRAIVRGGDPDEVIRAGVDELRAAGLSAPKVRYLRSLAEAVTSGSLDLRCIDKLTDYDVVDALTKVTGVGVWTAQMFLMFRLRRPDVLPIHDIGIQRGLQIAHGLRKPAAPGWIARAGARWAPSRSLACLYLWAAVDLRLDAAT
ncbi:MAG: DNA-3-methyladenine glycosylase 2 family protein [Deltaproteobacteria bacterium]|nr:DNA-3-methyladenine glycosylase 2 family protein [Deltaproteobacteria bacterium]